MAVWTLILLSVFANISLNVSLKAISPLMYPDTPLNITLRVLQSPWLWLSFVSGVVLISSFTLSLKTFPLSVSYTLVTCSTVVSLSVLGVVFGYEDFSVVRVAGVMFIVAGLILVAL